MHVLLQGEAPPAGSVRACAWERAAGPGSGTMQPRALRAASAAHAAHRLLSSPPSACPTRDGRPQLGKDRTGLIAALVLASCGLSDEEIVADYTR